jgi:hypothetical protein
VWSPLEYACHVRDVLSLYDERIARVVAEERPTLAAMRRDEVASERSYNTQPPSAVLDALAGNAEALAARLDGLGEDDWSRAGIRDGEELTVDWMARNVVHEGRHHLLDIGRGLRAARSG